MSNRSQKLTFLDVEDRIMRPELEISSGPTELIRNRWIEPERLIDHRVNELQPLQRLETYRPRTHLLLHLFSQLLLQTCRVAGDGTYERRKEDRETAEGIESEYEDEVVNRFFLAQPELVLRPLDCFSALALHELV